MPGRSHLVADEQVDLALLAQQPQQVLLVLPDHLE